MTANPADTEPPASLTAVSRDLVRNVHAPFAVRRFARTRVRAWGLPDLLDTAELVANELATNALEHGTGHFISVRLERHNDTITVKIWDANDTKLPEMTSANRMDEHGRGLLLTEVLSAQWGAYRSTTGGKVVWPSMLLTGDPRIYVRVYDAVKNDIFTGVLSPGQSVSPIAVLCRQHGGGRQTIAKALRMLEDEALLICYPGLGYYVVPEAVHGV